MPYSFQKEQRRRRLLWVAVLVLPVVIAALIGAAIDLPRHREGLSAFCAALSVFGVAFWLAACFALDQS